MRTFTKFLSLVAFTLLSSYQVQSQCNATITDFPHFEGFEDGSFSSNWSGDIETSTNTQDEGWKVWSGGTASNNTGPTGAASGTYYAYTETSNGTASAAQNTTFTLNWACFQFPANSFPYMTFDYHMRANSNAAMGSLALQVNTGSSWTTVWSDTGNQGSNWISVAVDLSAYANNTINVRFVGVSGSTNAWQGDRAIDNLYMSTGLNPSEISCPGGSNGSITAVAYFGTGSGYTYAWSNSATSQTITGLGAGTYTVTVTNTGSSTTKTGSYTLIDPVTPTPTNLTTDTTFFCDNNTQPVTLSIDFNTANETYSNTTSAQATFLSGSNAAATIEHKHGGTPAFATDSATVTFFYRGNLESEQVYVLSESGETLAVSAYTANQCGNQYESISFKVSADSINVWAEDDTISFFGDPENAVTGTTCGGQGQWGGFFNLTYPYSSTIPYWFENSCDSVIANAVDSGYIVQFEPSTTTTYYVRYYNANCNEWGDCDSVTINVYSPPTVTYSPANPNYCGTPTTITASGASTYNWNPGTGLNQTAGSTVQASPSTSTNYRLIGLSTFGCADTVYFTVTVTSGPSASVSSSNVDCFGGSDGSATVTASGTTGTVSYAWSNGGTSTSITNLTAGTYTVSVSDATTCVAVQSVTITQPNDLTVTLSTFNALCNGGSSGQIQAVPNGGTGTKTYLWSNGSTNSQIQNLAAGTYTVTVTDANGCTETEQATISQPAALSGSITAQTNVSCFGGNDGSATVTPTGGTSPYTYSWTGGGGNAATASSLSAGPYFVFIFDDNNCSAGPFGVTIDEPDSAVVVSITSSTNLTCNGSNDGAITANAVGGTGTKTYAWSNGGTGASISGLAAGTYTVTATDANGCTDTDDVTLTEPAAVTATFSNTNVSCNGGSDGAITATGSGGSGTFTSYAWSNGGSGATITGLTAGTYTVTATDNNGCTGTASTTLTEPTLLVSSINTSTNVSCNGDSDGTATASASGGTTTYTYSWNTGATTATATSLPAGTYSVTVTDANGCTDSSSIVITEPAVLVASIGTPTNVSCNGGNDGSATASATGGTTTYSYSWSGGGGSSATASSLTAGTYTVTVTDANGCTDTESVTITEPTAVSVSIGTPTNVSCNGGNDGSATASGTGGTGTITYAWSGGGGSSATATGLTAGTYTVTATDANGCTDTESVTITEPTAVTVSITSTNASCNGGANGTATASGSGGTGTITYAWNTGATTATITGLAAGTYTVTATDANGCTDSDDVTITEPTPVVASIGTPTNVSCNGGNDGSAAASASGGTGTYTYSWSGGGGSSATASGLTAGTYTVTATDANGCTDTESVTITEPALLVATIGTPTNVSCNGGNDGSATASATGGTTSYSYAWSGGGGSSATASSLTAGTYTVTVTDANGCTDTESVTITEPTAVSVSIGTPTNVSCNGGNDGSATASGTGGTGTITYAWSGGGGSSATATGLTAGTYTVTATDANGCTDTESVTITEPTAVTVSITSTNASCNGGANGTATASGSGGTGTITYAWNTGATTATITGLAAGTYTVTATDANGCTDSDNVTITEPTPVVASIGTPTNVSCNGDNDGAATASASGGTGTYTYSWSGGGGSSATASGLTAGTYTVTATDANGCTDTESVTITEPALLVATIGTPTNVSCNGGNDGSATASATGGTTSYSYAWSGGGGSSATASSLTAGTYTVTVTDANGCTDTESVTITEPTAVSVSIGTPTNVSCNGGNDGSATASGTGGTGTITYAWSGGGGSSATATGLTAGTYTVTATDANGCTDTESVTITEPTAVTVSITSTNASCNGGANGTATASGSGGTGTITYAWNTGATTATITGLAAGTYTVTATDANGCTDSDNVTITEPTPVVASIGTPTNVSCNGDNDGAATASASGGTGTYTYSWSGGGGSSATATGLTAGTYTVTATDANGCTDTESVTITEPALLVASIGTPTNVSCNGGNDGSATASATGGTTTYSYSWSGGGGSSATASSLTAGTYTVTVTDANGCTDTESVTITEPTAVSVSIGTPTNVSCNGGNDGSATASGTGGTGTITYAWSGGGGSSATATGLTAGTYTVTATDANGCTDTESVTITEPTPLVATASADNHVSCNGQNDGQATASGSGGTTSYSYSWSTGATSATATGLAAATYTVTVTDANGCTATDTVEITEPAILAITAAVDSNISCNGLSDGGATATVTGGTTAYSYSWNNGATTSFITGVAAGTYSVTVTDANACTDSTSVTITEPAVLVAAISLNNNVSCNGGNDGSATASATGGTTAYTFSWSTGASTATATGLAAGTYTVTVTDANGCTDTESITITEPTPVVVTMGTPTNVSCNGGNDGAVCATASGGTPSYTYAWSNSATGSCITGLTAGTYTVTATDANGCTDTETVTITEPTVLVATATMDNDVSCNGGSDGQATASGSGGTTAYSYLWSTGATSATATGLAAAIYTVTVTDANGCTETDTVQIDEPTVLTASTTTTNVSCNGAADGTATAAGSGGTPTYSYAWSTGASAATATNLGPGTYTVTVTDANGCTETANATITQPAVLVAAITLDSNVSCNGGNDASATASATGGTTAYSYAWSSGSNVATAPGLTAGTYTVTVTDANGCTDTESITITEPTPVVASAVVDSNVSCNSFSDGGATASGSGGTGGFTYMWNNAATTASITGVPAGTYSVTVTDANGCTDSTSIIITEPTPLVATASADNHVSCNGLSDGQATASGSGGTTAYSYAWSTGATTATATGLAAAIYTVTVTDANGCTATDTVEITEPAILAITTAVDSNVSCNGLSDGGATASVTGGTTAYSYSWNTGATTTSVTSLAAGTYSVTVTDANGCTDSTSVTITEPAVLVAAITLDSNVSCNGGNDGSATASATGGTTAYSYAWSSGSSTATAAGLTAGTYIVTVTDANGCTDTESITITEPTPVVASAVVDSNVSCNAGSDGGATASGSGGTGAFTYVWNNAANTASITGVPAGTYSVTVTDANGCTDSTSIVITEPTPLVATASADNHVSCNGLSDGQATASGSGGTTAYSYAWSTGATTATATGLAAAIYTVTVTDANGCTATDTVEITEPAILAITTAVDSNVSCNGLSDGGATASVTGGTTAYSYSWNTGATTTSVTGLAAGTYSVTVTDANGCTDSTSVTITEPAVLVAAITLDSNVSCNGGNDGSATASATGGTTAYSYAWSSGSNVATAPGLTAGTYTVTVTDANGCTDTESITITEPTPVVASVALDSNVSCNAGSDGGATASGSGGTGAFTYMWNNAATTASITGVPAGTYSVTVTDANGCTDSTSIIITEPTPLVATASADNHVSCNGLSDGQATASGSGGTAAYSYLWNTGATSATANGLTAGIYTVTLTDANNCTATDTVLITEPAVLDITANADTNVSCNGLSDGAASTSVTGGTATYTYVWNNGQTTSSATGLAAGTYSVTVTDANGCTDSTSVVITEPDVLELIVDSVVNVSCNGGNDGLACVSATGGTPTYSFAWSTGGSSACATGLNAGTYTVTVTDANGCTDTESITITEPTPVVASATVINNALCNGDSTGLATSSGSGGTAPYSYSWSNGSNIDSAYLAAGTWTAYVTDSLGCVDSTTVTITEPDSLIITLDSIDNVSCYGLTDGMIAANATGGTTAYGFSWSTGATTSMVNALAADTYYLTVTDANGCMTVDSFSISEPDSIDNAFTISNISCNSGNDAGIGTNASGGTPGYTYAWNTGATTDSISGLTAGMYTVTIGDTNGCENIFTAVVTEPDSLIASIILEDSVLCAGDSTGMAVALGIGGTSPYTFAWPAGFTAINDTLLGLPAGNYVVTITDDNGCVDSVTAVIEQPLPIALSIDSTVDVTCEGGNDGYGEISASGGIAPYTYAWANGGTSASNNALVGGSNVVTVTDANGCSDTISVFLNETYPIPVVDLGDDTIVCGATYTLTAGLATTYLWSTSDTTQSIVVDSSAYYSVVAGDTNGCSNSDTVLVIFNPLLSFSVDTDSSDCSLSNGSATITNLTGGGNYSISWSSGQNGGLIDNNLGAGNYAVTVTDQNGCSEAQGFTIGAISDIATTASSTGATCSGGTDGTAMVSVIGGALPYQYAWSNGGSTDSIGGLGAGTYLVTVTDINGCLAIDTAVVTDGDTISVFATSSNTTCGDSNGTGIVTNVLPAGSYTYLWNDPYTQTTTTADSLYAGVYTVTATATNGCEGVATVIVSETPSATLIMSSVNAACSDELSGTGQAIVSATGTEPLTYIWNDAQSQTNDTASNLMNGTYYVTVTDSAGCVSIASVGVGFDNTAPTISLGGDETVCGNIHGIGVGAGYNSYNWNTGDTTSNIIVSTTGTYAITVSDGNACEATDSATITFINPMVVTSAITDADCGDTNGAITLTVTSGTGNYSYFWSNGASTSALTGLAGGVYVVTVSDTTGCDVIDSITVNQIGAPAVSIATTDALCFNGSDGSAASTVTGGASPYSYAWSNGGTASSISSVAPGSYSLSVTDNDGCVVIETVTISSGPEMIASITGINPECGDSNGTAEVTIVGNQGPASFIWNDANATDTSYVDSLMAGFYTVTISDSAGCATTESIVLNNDNAPILIMGSTDNICSNETIGTAFVIPFGLNTPFTYSWNDGAAQSTDTASNLASGMYMVTVTDTAGCMSIGSTTVGSFNTAPIVSLGDDRAACFGSEVILTPGGQFATYFWNTGASTPSVNATLSQPYDVFVTDINGCSGSDAVNVTLETAPVVDLGNDTVICEDIAGASYVLNAGTFNNYDWSTSETTSSITVTTSGTYTVTVSNIPECSSSDQIIVLFETCVNVTTEELAGEEAPELNIYPNPNRGQFTLETSGLKAGTYRVMLMSSSGQLVMNTPIEAQSGVSTRNEMNIQSVDAGVYMLVIEGENFRMDSRVIVQ